LNHQEITKCANDFWKSAGFAESFPRSLETAVSWALPLAVIKMPNLTFSKLDNWFFENGSTFQNSRKDRSLRACLMAKNGKGLIFLDGTDSKDEMRFSMAHETAHFLIDYFLPRKRVFKALGEKAYEILDGVRLPTPEEKLSGILRGVRLGVFEHLIERSDHGAVKDIEVLEAEDHADNLALELLAPRLAVIAKLKSLKNEKTNDLAIKMTQKIIVDGFGLPSLIAERYAKMLAVSRSANKSFKEWLGV
jgi:hypothetical protein